MIPLFASNFVDSATNIRATLPFERIYHNQYLNATRSPHYRYQIVEVRTYLDITVLKGTVSLDSQAKGINFLRLEYGGHRLNELVREKNRFLRDQIEATITLPGDNPAQATVKMHFDRWIQAYQVEIWQTLELPPTVHHDYAVLDIMGSQGQITCVPAFAAFFENLANLMKVQVIFKENDYDLLSGSKVNDPVIDDNYGGVNKEVLQGQDKPQGYYQFDFQRAWVYSLEAKHPALKEFSNYMIEPAEDKDAKTSANTINLRWLLQTQLGGSLVFLQETLLPPGHSEGTHRLNGTEAIYLFTGGEGMIYLGEGDIPDLPPTVEPTKQPVYKLGLRSCVKRSVKRNDLVFVKSGGTIGVVNTGPVHLKYLVLLYYTA